MEGSGLAPSDSVEIVTKTGKRIASDKIKFAKGSHQLRIDRHELWIKFADCLGRDIPESVKSSAFENLMNFERLSSVDELTLRVQ
jgi:hypothetical protein